MPKEMHLYNLTLTPTSHSICQCIGNFSGLKQQEILIAKHDRLELIKVLSDSGKFETLYTSYHTFGIIRCIQPFRLTGGNKDYAIIGGDSGRIVILEYDPKLCVFNKVHQETFGKTGVRRVVPGQYIACDPKGRAVMLGAIEKQKLVYVLNRDSLANLTISSPLEAHRTNTILYSLVGLDVSFDNPIFAAIELDYTEADTDNNPDALDNIEKLLTYYELDLGLNHVVRKWSTPIDPRANFLMAVPGGNDGPSGVIICSENSISYLHQGSVEHKVPIPRRKIPIADYDRGILIVCGALHKMKNTFFILLQSEEGDIYKVTLDHKDGEVNQLKIKYFDTLPVASGFSILKSGYIALSPESGNFGLYQFIALGEKANDEEFSSLNYLEQEEIEPVYFQPRALVNLQQTDEIESISPVIDCKVMNLTNDDTPQFYTLCGKGSQSSFRVLKYGLFVNDVGEMQLPGRPTAVWTANLKKNPVYIASFTNATLVLTLNENPEEVNDSGILTNTQTIHIQELNNNSIVQVYPNGIRHIQSDDRVNEWKPPKDKLIISAVGNKSQILIALSGNELIYFEIDNSGLLSELNERMVMSSQITAMCLGDIKKDRKRFPYAMVGCADHTVRTISLDPNTPMQALSMQALADTPLSLCAIEMSSKDANYTLYLHIGLQNGIMLRTVMDQVSGALSDTRTRFLGSKPVKLFQVIVNEQPAVMALSSRPWLSYHFQNKIHTMPLQTDALEFAAPFSTESIPEGIVGISGDLLKIINFDRLDQQFQQDTIPLKYTPRRVILNPYSNHFVVLETENNTFSPSEIKRVIEAEGEDNALSLDPTEFGLPKAMPGRWASQIRILNPLTGETTQEIELDENEAAFSICLVQFHNQYSDIMVAVGTAVESILSPRSCSAAYIRLYKFDETGTQLSLVHRTQVEDIPMALLQFQGRLLAGVGRLLRIYDLGKMKLLRKCQTKAIPNTIVNLHSQGERIIISDVQESIHFAAYTQLENQLMVFADDTLPAFTSATCYVDYNTVAVGDKFGNIFLARLPNDVVSEIEGEGESKSNHHKLPPTNRGILNGATYKLERLCHFHIGDAPMSIEKTSLIRGANPILVYTTLLGRIGALIPFLTKDDVEFFQTLEFHLRIQLPLLAGRDHLSYRSSFAPVKAVIDGDLCETFGLLDMNKKQEIAEELGCSVSEVLKKIEDMRTLVAY
ncbi:hypothetical protein K502DRAFT_365900 [Neoconidiobolus thromboides FSU 785]|nr:hypothetical protein K502DRAFT_365900 [Neoconidiobolus thromboides FSU 785]